MKKQFLLLLAGCLVAFGSKATVYTVDNNIPSGGQYTTLAAAQTAASAGDTLYITGSAATYGNFQFTKPLVLIGTGHNPQKDNQLVSTLDDITFSGSTQGDGSQVIGISFRDYTAAFSMPNWSILRCSIRNVLYMTAGSQTNVLIEGNVFAAATNVFNNTGNTWNNVVFRNNVFNGASAVSVGSGSVNVLFLNNLFLNNGAAFYQSTNYVAFKNNIYYRADPVSSVTSSLFENNVIDAANTAAFSGGSSNTFTGNFQANPAFVNYPAAGADFSYAHDYRLQATSTLINAGTDGKDIGLTGGNGYFDINGIPPIPQVYKLDITTPANGTVAPGGSITIDLRSTIKQ